MSLFLPIFRALNECGARYVAVGGFAVVLHGHARFTADLDLVIDLDPSEAMKVVAALEDLGFQPRAPVAAEDFADPEIRRGWIEEKGMQVFSLFDPDNPLLTVDLFVSHPLPFDDLYSRSEVVTLQGVEVRMASIPDLIELKRIAGRSEDLQDVKALEEIQRLKRKG